MYMQQFKFIKMYGNCDPQSHEAGVSERGVRVEECFFHIK